jgi:hypothetical protein
MILQEMTLSKAEKHGIRPGRKVKDQPFGDLMEQVLCLHHLWLINHKILGLIDERRQDERQKDKDKKRTHFKRQKVETKNSRKDKKTTYWNLEPELTSIKKKKN